MPVDGLSLVGFMGEPRGVGYLKADCGYDSKPKSYFRERWQEAHTRLGPRQGSPGGPDIRGIPGAYDGHLDQLRGSAPVTNAFGPAPVFKLVEIDALLAFQFHVAIPHADDLCAPLTDIPPDGLPFGATTPTIMEVCLPTVPPTLQVTPSMERGSIVVKASELSLDVLAPGRGRIVVDVDGMAVMGFPIALPISHVNVARFQGIYYLRNGYHRAYGLRKRGVTHIPCVLLDATNYGEVGIRPNGTFDATALQSANPPTCRHFNPRHAYPVPLRERAREISVSYTSKIV